MAWHTGGAQEKQGRRRQRSEEARGLTWNLEISRVLSCSSHGRNLKTPFSTATSHLFLIGQFIRSIEHAPIQVFSFSASGIPEAKAREIVNSHDCVAASCF